MRGRALFGVWLAAAAACGGGEASDPARPDAAPSAAPATSPSVVGRWQRVNSPDEWLEFGADGSFSFPGTDVRGRYRQQGAKVTLEVLPRGHGATLTLQDTLLVMEEGSRYRRAPR